MKTFKRASLHKSINYNGKTYDKYFHGSPSILDDVICIKVLPSRLKGVRDLYGNFYKPTTHYLTIS